MIDPQNYDRIMLESNGVSVALIQDEDEDRLNILAVDEPPLEIRGENAIHALRDMLNAILGPSDA